MFLSVLDAIKLGETWIMVRMPHLWNCFPRIRDKAQTSLKLRSNFLPSSHRPKYLSHWPANSEDNNDNKTWDVLKKYTHRTVILWRIIEYAPYNELLEISASDFVLWKDICLLKCTRLVRRREMDTKVSAEIKDIYHRKSPEGEENWAIFADKFNQMQELIILVVLWIDNKLGIC